MRTSLFAMALGLNVALPIGADAQIDTDIYLEPCDVLAVYQRRPEIVRADLAAFLKGVNEALKATGLPSGSFEADYLKICTDNPGASIAQAIKFTFDAYLTVPPNN